MKSVQISKSLFIDLVNYFIPDEGKAIGEDKELEERIIDGLHDKIERLAKHFDYTDRIREGR